MVFYRSPDLESNDTMASTIKNPLGRTRECLSVSGMHKKTINYNGLCLNDCLLVPASARHKIIPILS